MVLLISDFRRLGVRRSAAAVRRRRGASRHLLDGSLEFPPFAGAKFVKGFNHLPAAALAADPVVEGGHRVVFLSSDDEDAIGPVAGLAKQLGFAPVKLGKLNEGGALVQARGRTWGPLIFQDLFKKEQ